MVFFSLKKSTSVGVEGSSLDIIANSEEWKSFTWQHQNDEDPCERCFRVHEETGGVKMKTPSTPQQGALMNCDSVSSCVKLGHYIDAEVIWGDLGVFPI